jgi:hypothetical protein
MGEGRSFGFFGLGPSLGGLLVDQFEADPGFLCLA